MTGSGTANVGMYSTRLVHKGMVEGNAYITVGDPCKLTLLCAAYNPIMCLHQQMTNLLLASHCYIIGSLF